MGYGPMSSNTASLCIVQPRKQNRNEVQNLHVMKDQELMQEVEVLRLTEAAFMKWF